MNELLAGREGAAATCAINRPKAKNSPDAVVVVLRASREQLAAYLAPAP